MGDLEILMQHDRQRAVDHAIDLVVSHGINPAAAAYIAFAGMPTRIGEIARRAISIEPLPRKDLRGTYPLPKPECGFVWKLKGKDNGQKA